MTAEILTGDGRVPCSDEDRRGDDPFQRLVEVPVPGGRLSVAQAGPPPAEADAVAVAIHGVTSSHMAFRTVARALGAGSRVCLLAPDLRGRGRSAAVPGPFGLETHVRDVLAVLDATGVDRAILVGHSMGAYIAARLAADHPDRCAALVLLDGGLYLPFPPDEDPEALLEMMVEQVASRLGMTFSSADDYVQRWSEHPALRREWNDDLDAYARFELTGAPGQMRCTVSEEAAIVDCAELMRDETTQRALERVTAPIYLARAERGLLDDLPVLPDEAVEAFASAHRGAQIHHMAGCNHYTMVLGSGPGPKGVAALIRAATPHAMRG